MQNHSRPMTANNTAIWKDVIDYMLHQADGIVDHIPLLDRSMTEANLSPEQLRSQGIEIEHHPEEGFEEEFLSQQIESADRFLTRH